MGGHYGFVEQHSTAYYSAGWIHAFDGYMPQYRPLNPEWPEVADIVSNYISDVFAKQISAEEAMEIANEEVAEVYREAGYIS